MLLLLLLRLRAAASQVEPLARRVPWMVGIGNHERDWPGARFYIISNIILYLPYLPPYPIFSIILY